MYNGFQPYYLSVNEITTYWSTHNNTDANPTVSMLPNLNTMDGSTVESRIWENGDQCVSIKELKVINGGHDWPGVLEIWILTPVKKFGNLYQNLM